MSEIIVTNRVITTAVIIALAAVIIAGVVGYSLGVSRGLRQAQAPADLSATSSDQPTRDGNQPSPTQGEGTEVTVSDGETQVEGKTMLSGTISAFSDNGFVLQVASQTLNTVSRTLNQKTTNYQVIVTPSTKMTKQVSQVVIPAEGGLPQVTSTTRTIKLYDLQLDQAATVITADSASARQVTALEVRVTMVERK